jgi:hypothetical protein
VNAKQALKAIPMARTVMHWLAARRSRPKFAGSEDYWIGRYQHGGTSGAGSYAKLAYFKADVVNDFVEAHHITSVIEYGCGDGNQLKLMKYPSYRGFDVSAEALSRCMEIFRDDETKSFRQIKQYAGEVAELTLSLDVIFHLVEDGVFEDYMRRLFGSSSRFVIIYSSNKNDQSKMQAPHVRHRKFTQWIDDHIKGWRLVNTIPNRYPYMGDVMEGSFSDFFIYEKS